MSVCLNLYTIGRWNLYRLETGIIELASLEVTVVASYW